MFFAFRFPPPPGATTIPLVAAGCCWYTRAEWDIVKDQEVWFAKSLNRTRPAKFSVEWLVGGYLPARGRRRERGPRLTRLIYPLSSLTAVFHQSRKSKAVPPQTIPAVASKPQRLCRTFQPMKIAGLPMTAIDNEFSCLRTDSYAIALTALSVVDHEVAVAQSSDPSRGWKMICECK